jgi:hypothetical protein
VIITPPSNKDLPSAVNGLGASRPNLFRTGRRTGPRWVPAHSPSPPRDPPPNSRRFKADVVR